MKRWGGLIGGLAILGTFGFGVYKLREAKVKLPVDQPVNASVAVPKGTKVDLILMESLSSGGTEVGHSVKLAVLNDVIVGGQVVIRRGDAAVGKVTVSRAGTTFGFLDRKPARLSLELESVTPTGNSPIPIFSGKGKSELPLTDDNTRIVSDDAVATALSDPKSREEITKLSDQLLKQGTLPADINTYDKVANDLGLQKTQELIKRGEGKAPSIGLSKTLEALNKGDIGALTGVDGILAAQALGELTDVASSVDRKLRGILKGHNIRANIGLVIHAEVAQPATLTTR